MSINTRRGPGRLRLVTAIRPGGAGDWRLRAVCRHVDPELFFPISNSGASLDQVTRAKAVCANCEARPDCLAFALRTGQRHGIWGGLTEDERGK